MICRVHTYITLTKCSLLFRFFAWKFALHILLAPHQPWHPAPKPCGMTSPASRRKIFPTLQPTEWPDEPAGYRLACREALRSRHHHHHSPVDAGVTSKQPQTTSRESNWGICGLPNARMNDSAKLQSEPASLPVSIVFQLILSLKKLYSDLILKNYSCHPTMHGCRMGEKQLAHTHVALGNGCVSRN